MTIQFINDEEGNPQYVVIGYDEYTRMISYDSEEMIEDDEDDTINYNSDEYYY
jgi:hypothetical protein